MGTLTHKGCQSSVWNRDYAVLKTCEEKIVKKVFLELVDLTEKYMGDNFQKEKL